MSFDNSPTRYRCALSGHCEPSEEGYAQYSECQANCTSTENKDLIYLTLSYIPQEALQLAPSDQIRVVSDIIGKKLPFRSANQVLKALASDSWLEQRSVPELQDFLREKYDAIDMLIADYRYSLNLSILLPIDHERMRGLMNEVLERHRPSLRRMLELNQLANITPDEEDERFDLYQVLSLELLQLFVEADGDTEVMGFFDDITNILDELV
ncbi:MAG: hypothetical protein WC208_15510 [Gallionella sp.]|jgi:hypothetical protein